MREAKRDQERRVFLVLGAAVALGAGESLGPQLDRAGMVARARLDHAQTEPCVGLLLVGIEHDRAFERRARLVGVAGEREHLAEHVEWTGETWVVLAEP